MNKVSREGARWGTLPERTCPDPPPKAGEKEKKLCESFMKGEDRKC